MYVINGLFPYLLQSEKRQLPPPGPLSSGGHFGYRSESTGQPCWRRCWPSPATGSVDTLAHRWRSHTWGKDSEFRGHFWTFPSDFSWDQETGFETLTVGITKAKTTRTKVSATMCCKHKLHVLELHTDSKFKPSLDLKEFMPLSWSSVLALGSESAGNHTSLWSSDSVFEVRKCHYEWMKTATVETAKAVNHHN